MSQSDYQDVVLGHADEADGIEEYDNRLPTWWVGLFFGCVVWGGIYLAWWHFIEQTSQAKQYDEEVAAAAVLWPAPAAGSVTVANDPAAIAEGEAIYKANCVGCHGPELTGGIGPNLKDADWIHGGTLAEITTTVTNGVTAKGMLAWGPILGPKKVAQVSAFVHAQGGGK